MLTETPIPSHPDLLAVRVITQADDPERLTFVRTTDARTALARGLAEYLAQVSIVWEGGRRVQFERVYVEWAEMESPEVYPAAALVAIDDAEYEDAELSPRTVQVSDGTRRYVRAVAELQQEFQLQLWTTDPEERAAMVAMVEDALSPADFMYGLRLELPFYFGARATYEPLSVLYQDDEAAAQHQWRRAIITVRGHVPQYVPVGAIELLRPKAQVYVEDGEAGS
jgi:hypothetical protein